jgi:lipoate-protein ligase A
VDGRKVVGSAQRRIKNSFLQHGSMPITCDREALAQATGMEETESLYREMAGIAEFLPDRPSVTVLINALIGSFQDRFGIEFRRREND